MGIERIIDEEAVFTAALAIVEPDQRAAYLRQACGGDAALLCRVEALLRVQASERSALEAAASSLQLTLDEPAVSEGPGSVIGRYKLLERIGEGGMAAVYMAEQQEPIRRKVALKIIKLGMDTRQVIARFEAERQALALMDHPNIAKVLDAGATETGRPYFVMELVQGVSITEYCDKNNLSTKDRLAQFLQVCQAVQHAHQKGIIHRDIKPSNVMVTHHDGRPVPKVIDFGIAKATNQRLTEKTLFTRYAHIIGTPAYMSPEQAELSDLDIDTRTDIYSLGVLLYELLTGTTPFSEEELRKAGYIEMQRVIREQEPAKPSTKLSTLGDTLTDIAKHRNSTPQLLRKALRGDLDWIVMKTLEKDRARRYDTPNALASDILRHLEHQPVLARWPGTVYHLQKLLRRHRGQVFAGAVTAVVTGAMVTVFSTWNRDRLRLAEAEGFRHRTILSQAREQYAKGDRQAALETSAPMLRSKYVGPEAQLLYASILADDRRSDEAMTLLGALLRARPQVAGAAHSLLARIFWEKQSATADKSGEIEEHRHQAEALLPETAEAYFLRAMTAITIKDQLASLDRALQLDSQHYESRRLRAFIYYASRKYDRLRDDALVMTVLRPRDPLGYSLRAIAFGELARYAEAVAEYDSAIALTPKADVQYVDLSAQRCQAFLRMGDYERLILDAQQCAALWPDKAVFQYYTFCATTALGEYEKANILFSRIVSSGQDARRQFQGWCMKYVFDTLEAGRPWHPPERPPTGTALLPMAEAEETYIRLSARARRVIDKGFTSRWSPDGKKLAFSTGVIGYSGVAIFDPATGETELLITPGKDPVWSPDGKHIAFVRDCQVLRLPELVAAERKSQLRSEVEQEVWVMRSDGTGARHLARGSWPSWSRDSKSIYVHSLADGVLSSISLTEAEAGPKWIAACPGVCPAVSPDERHLTYLEGRQLKVKDLMSQAVIANWQAPPSAWGGCAWSPDGREICMGAANATEDRGGLWIYRLGSSEPAKVLDGPIGTGFWAPDGTKMMLFVGGSCFEIWTADLDPNVSAVESLGPGQTLGDYLWEKVAFYTRRIEADPRDAYAYTGRAQYYEYLHDRAKAEDDMLRWSAIGGGPADLQALHAGPDLILGQAEHLGRTINSPNNDYLARISADGSELYFCSDRPDGRGSYDIWVAKRAGPQDPWGPPENLGSQVNSPLWEEIGSVSADGLTLYLDVWDPVAKIYVATRPTKHAPWGPRVLLGPVFNASGGNGLPCLSADDRELYFTSSRLGGYGNGDIWVSTRASSSAPWGPAVNLGAAANTPYDDRLGTISPDGRMLLLTSNRPGGFGGYDEYVTTRASKDSPWRPAQNLGASFNTAPQVGHTCLSPDGQWLYFDDPNDTRPGAVGGYDLWRVPIIRSANSNDERKGKGKED